METFPTLRVSLEHEQNNLGLSHLGDCLPPAAEMTSGVRYLSQARSGPACSISKMGLKTLSSVESVRAIALSNFWLVFWVTQDN